MSQQRNWLEGEVRFAEGKTTIKNLLSTLAKELTTSDWRILDRTALDTVWTFDHKKEIWLPSAYDNTNLRLYKAVPGVGGFTKGDLIPTTDYILVYNILIGVQNIAVGEHVFVEVLTLATEFQRGSFLSRTIDSGDVRSILELKSRPKGKIKLFQDDYRRIENEVPLNKGDRRVYQLAKTPVSTTKNPVRKLIVKRNGEVVEDYVTDFWNGVIVFVLPNQPSDVITASYDYSTGLGGTAVIPEAKYKIIDNQIYDMTPTNELLNQDVIVMVDYTWKMEYPAAVASITERVLFSTEIDVSEKFDKSQMQKYYWELKYTDYELQNSPDYRTHILTRYGSDLNDTLDGLDDDTASVWTPFSWYKPEGFIAAENNGATLYYEDWLPVHYWLNHTQESINIVIQGDPGVDIAPYQNYIIAYGYIGALESYPCMATEDRKNNFAFTFGSHKIPNYGSFPDTWGARQATGNTDISLIKTQSNIPFQAHLPAFHTSPEFMDKHFISVSQWTGTHHFSEVTVVHAYERERGKLRDVLIGDRSSIFHLDELISNKDKFDYRGALYNCDKNILEKGQPLDSKQKHWKMFNINAPYWLGNNSPNVHYGIAIRTR